MRLPCHHSLDQYLNAWITAASISGDKKGPLFRSFKKGDKLTGDPMIRSDVLYMITTAAKIGPDDQAFHCDLDFHTQGVNARPPPPERVVAMRFPRFALRGLSASAGARCRRRWIAGKCSLDRMEIRSRDGTAARAHQQIPRRAGVRQLTHLETCRRDE